MVESLKRCLVLNFQSGRFFTLMFHLVLLNFLKERQKLYFFEVFPISLCLSLNMFGCDCLFCGWTRSVFCSVWSTPLTFQALFLFIFCAFWIRTGVGVFINYFIVCLIYGFTSIPPLVISPQNAFQ